MGSNNVKNGLDPPPYGVSGLVGLGRNSDFWKVLGLARNPFKKMRLDESFRMVRVPCRNSASIKSYGQITVTTKIQKIGATKNV